MKAPSAWGSVLQWWAARDAREQRFLTLAGFLILIALVVSLFVTPALRVVRAHATTDARLKGEWQTMLQLQAQARALQSQPRQNASTAKAALQSATGTLGAQADLAFGPEGARVTMRNVPAQLLAEWLSVVRLQAGSVPLQASLNHTGAGWSGTLVMTLPGP